MLRPWVLAVAAAVCAVVAVVIPRGAWVDDINVVDAGVTRSSLTVQIDDHRVVLHAPEGYAIEGWGADSEPSVQVTMRGGREIVHVRIGPGRAPDEVLRRGTFVEEIVDGATMTVFASGLADEVVQRMFDELEIS